MQIVKNLPHQLNSIGYIVLRKITLFCWFVDSLLFVNIGFQQQQVNNTIPALKSLIHVPNRLIPNYLEIKVLNQGQTPLNCLQYSTKKIGITIVEDTISYHSHKPALVDVGSLPLSPLWQLYHRQVTPSSSPLSTCPGTQCYHQVFPF